MNQRFLDVLGAILALVMVAALLDGCGEASVTYTGTVVEDLEAGHSFDDQANPQGLSPLEGSLVTICICRGACDEECTKSNPKSQVESEADGHWELSQTFGASSSNHGVEIYVLKEGYAAYRYRTVYEKADDPTNGEQFLNIRLLSTVE